METQRMAHATIDTDAIRSFRIGPLVFAAVRSDTTFGPRMTYGIALILPGCQINLAFAHDDEP